MRRCESMWWRCWSWSGSTAASGALLPQVNKSLLDQHTQIGCRHYLQLPFADSWCCLRKKISTLCVMQHVCSAAGIVVRFQAPCAPDPFVMCPSMPLPCLPAASLGRRYPGHASQQHFHELGEELSRSAASAAAAASAGAKAAASRGSAGKRKLPMGNAASKRQKDAACASPQAAEAAAENSCGQNAAPGGGTAESAMSLSAENFCGQNAAPAGDTAESTISPGASKWAADIGGKVSP